MATLKTLCGLSPSRPLSHTVCVLLLAFLGVFAQGQGPGTQNSKITMSVVEEKPAGVVVGTLPVRNGYTYNFEQPSTLFELDDEGVIRTKIRIDREALIRERGKDSIDLFIEGTHPTEVFHPIDVTIRVLDLNDNAPRFAENRISVSFQEDAQSGQQQLIDTAVDPDNGLNGTITEYRIFSGDEGKFRLIPPNEESPYMFVATEGSLDRETRDSYQLNISAVDGGDNPLSGYLQLFIDITDVNDNPPTFDHSDYVTQVNESAEVGTSVIRVEATDRDMGDNAEIFYFVTDSSAQFTIEERTGVIRTLTSPLQCSRTCGNPGPECNPYSCLLTVVARDGGRTPLEGRAYITVAVIDENDHDPLITFQPLHSDPVTGYATIDENAVGLRVASISVRDADHGVNGETSVQIISGNELGHFRHVSISSPVSINYIQVQGSLDRENIAQYNLTLKAVDHGNPPRSSTAFLIIIVNDANDHAPVFQKTEYRTQMSELAMPGSYVAGVKAVDEDSGPNSQLTYDIIAGNDHSWFAIDDATGLVTTRVALDHETTQRVVLNISAHDSGTTPFYNYTKLVVDILDENDMAPRFQKVDVSVELDENQAANQELTTLTADDYDSGVNGTVTYRLHSDTQLLYPDTFQADRTSGRVSTRKALDRESMPFCQVKVIAQDGGTPPLSSTATIHLTVMDLNDNVPVFEPKTYYVNVFETDPAGIQAVQVSAVDADSGMFGRVTYEFTGNIYSSFTINQYTGMISTTTQLRRSVRSSYQLSVVARDGGERTSQEQAKVNVIVGNMNDAAPVFPSRDIIFEITEDNRDQATNVGQTVGQVQASGGGGSIRYGITGGDPLQVFSIDSVGVIKRDKIIDHEVQSKYILTVIAHTGSRFGEKKVTINVKDLNDNKPRFLATSTETVVMEDWPVGDNIFLAGAVDADSGLNAQLTYTLHSVQDVSGVFGIDPQTGIISLKKPTTQLAGNSQVTLTVTVQDSGTPPQSDSMDVIVKIQDVNDHTPIFPMNVYRFHLPESKPVNEIIMKFVATDIDEGRNGELVYSILRGNEEGRFGIFPDGMLFVAHALDRETRDMYSLTVQVHDCGDARRSSSANVTIYILDANDNNPVFNNASYTFTVAENRPMDTFVGRVKATDHDVGQNAEVVYSLTEGNANFSINPITGEIFTKRPFDREYIMDTSSVEFYIFEVFATDDGDPKLRGKTTVKVFVTDVNDNPPVFARPLFNAAVPENAVLDTNIIKMTATDIDVGANAAVTYVIVKGNEDGKFSITETTGEITVSGVLDRETKDHYLLTVEATDTGSDVLLSSSAQVSVTVIDYNDNVPVFTSSFRELHVEETRPLGELLTVFSGKDADLGNNAKIFFSIYSGNEEGVFNLDGYTGKLYLVRELDYETRREYSLNVSVTDAGYHPSLSSHDFLTIKVIDVNDNPPVFTDGFSSVNIREDQQKQGPVSTLAVSDKDSGNFGKVRFAIISQDPNEGTFSINADSGAIYVVRDLDRERTDYYKLTITATDQASPASLRHTAQRTLKIFIGDVNDNAPVFKSAPAYVVSSRARSGQIIAEVFADDADTGENGEVSYSLVSQTSLFSIGASTGQISLLQNMPSSPESYTLHVLAIDNGNSGQNDRLPKEATITIILSSGEPGPVFANRSYSGSLSESHPANTSVFRVSASATRGEAVVKYYLTGIKSEGVQRGEIFRVDASSGEVTNVEQLDRETLGGTFTLNITAMEINVNSLRTRTTQVRHFHL
nr:hypothetical protein BaRGS_005082 [Batillaria attramentaria]